MCGTTLSSDVRDNRAIFYTMHSRTAENARAELGRQIRHVQKADYKPSNPVLETISIVNLERSAVPEQAALGQLMSMVERLSGDISNFKTRFGWERQTMLLVWLIRYCDLYLRSWDK
jgi:hypothetical protein